MILMYHKIDIITPTIWWVTPLAFEQQIERLKERKFVFLDDYTSPENQAVITFDDAYENVFHHALPVLAAHKLPFEVFVIGDSIGGWNDFDPSEPLTRHMGMDHLEEIVRHGGRLQWHSRSHPSLPSLDEEELCKELTVTESLRKKFPPPHFTWFSYPGGEHDDRAVKAVSQTFSGAVSVIEGKLEDRWQLNRITVDQHTAF